MVGGKDAHLSSHPRAWTPSLVAYLYYGRSEATKRVLNLIQKIELINPIMLIPIGKQLYYYRAEVKDVYDGDTFRADIDLGLNICISYKGQSFRLADIDTPELRGDERPDGLIVRDYVRDLILGKEVIVNTMKTGKFGRWLAWVFLENSGIIPSTTSLNEHLLKIGYAVSWGEPWTGLPSTPE